jgi:hypothetical protein
VKRPALLLAAGLFGLALALSGCKEEEIQTYRAPRDDPPAGKMLLGAIVPREDAVWFFKLTGPERAVRAQREAFTAFLQSLRFKADADAPVQWQLPAGWRQVSGPTGGTVRTFATIHIGLEGKPLSLTVTQLGPESAAVRPNVDRWRRQLELEHASDEEFARQTRPITVDGRSATYVEITTSEAT